MRRALRVAVVLLALLIAVAPLTAEEVKSVQKEIKSLERSLSTARSTEQAAEQKVLRNRRAQSAAAKGDLPALKRKAVALQASLNKARKAHEKLATSLKAVRHLNQSKQLPHPQHSCVESKYQVRPSDYLILD